MKNAVLLVQRKWREISERRRVMWDKGEELLREEEDRYRYFLVTDALLDGEDGFCRRCLHFDNLAQRWNIPNLDGVQMLSSVPDD